MKVMCSIRHLSFENIYQSHSRHFVSIYTVMYNLLTKYLDNERIYNAFSSF